MIFILLVEFVVSLDNNVILSFSNSDNQSNMGGVLSNEGENDSKSSGLLARKNKDYNKTPETLGKKITTTSSVQNHEKNVDQIITVPSTLTYQQQATDKK